MGMRLDSALKLYIALYVLCFCMTWFISVPMLIHVSPQSECLLFVSPYVRYGPPVVCQLIGFLPIMVALCAVILIVLHAVQLRSLYAFLRKRTPHTSDYHERPTHIFWRMVVFHAVVTGVVLIIAALNTAGYVTTCQNLHREVSLTVRARVKADLYGGGESANEHYDRFANDRSIDRYTNQNRDIWGRHSQEQSITCRKVLTDPYIHSQLKQNLASNPYYKQYHGFWYGDEVADVGNIRYLSSRDNTILELCMAGAWISFALWLAILILMIKERHHIKSHLTDGSVYSRSNSRMSSHSFDKMSSSRYSNYSGSQMSGSRRSANGSSGGRRGQPPPSRHQSSDSYLQDPVLPPPEPKMNYKAAAPATQSSLMNYFSLNPPTEDEVDVDAALEESDIQPQAGENFEFNETGLDQSFELPVMDDGHGGPYPMGDEVSSGRISQEIPIHMEPLATSDPQPYRHNPNSNPNRMMGRRGARLAQQFPSYDQQSPDPPQFDVSPISNGDVGYPSQSYEPEFNDYDPEPEFRQPAFNNHNHVNSNGYKTHLGNQSMI